MPKKKDLPSTEVDHAEIARKRLSREDPLWEGYVFLIYKGQLCVHRPRHRPDQCYPQKGWLRLEVRPTGHAEVRWTRPEDVVFWFRDLTDQLTAGFPPERFPNCKVMWREVAAAIQATKSSDNYSGPVTGAGLGMPRSSTRGRRNGGR